jgi:hypothetical protein
MYSLTRLMPSSRETRVGALAFRRLVLSLEQQLYKRPCRVTTGSSHGFASCKVGSHYVRDGEKAKQQQHNGDHHRQRNRKGTFTMNQPFLLKSYALPTQLPHECQVKSDAE